MSSQAHANGPAGHTSAPPKAAQAGGKAFSNAAKKDPALLPLALIIGGAVCTAAYFFSTKGTGSGDPAKKFAHGKEMTRREAHSTSTATWAREERLNRTCQRHRTRRSPSQATSTSSKLTMSHTRSRSRTVLQSSYLLRA
ncbi:hypothetical protein P389DRAFT_61151 [Cystobasidium minutum MCA 4210]|uniref:uncharacterized protein n=1 Tax=Cystobasidium minutum MCA 4210 TaxID=1397322 RepID=UPI0034CF493A|eukprot:jgi/Rhomi1/61151/CE61150_45141